MTGVSFVIPSFNDADMLRRNLPAVQEAAAAVHDSEIIVVDDASPDRAVDALKTHFQAIRWLHHEYNKGFAGAVATGVSAAGGDVLLLLNSDVAPEAGFLVPLLKAMKDPSVFAVSPMILDEEGAAQRVSWNRYEFKGGRFQAVRWCPDDIAAVARPLLTLYASGGAMAVRRSYFLDLGGFAPLYRPFYVEDFDLGARAWRHGWRVLFEPRSRVVHQRMGAINTNVRREAIKRTQRRNGLLFEWSHFAAWRIFLYRAPYYAKQLVGRCLRGDWDYVAGFSAALRALPAACRHRRRVQADSVFDFEAVLKEVQRL